MKIISETAKAFVFSDTSRILKSNTKAIVENKEAIKSWNETKTGTIWRINIELQFKLNYSTPGKTPLPTKTIHTRTGTLPWDSWTIDIRPKATLYLDRCRAIDKRVGHVNAPFRLLGVFAGDYIESAIMRTTSVRKNQTAYDKRIEQEFIERMWGAKDWYSFAVSLIKTLIDTHCKTPATTMDYNNEIVFQGNTVGSIAFKRETVSENASRRSKRRQTVIKTPRLDTISKKATDDRKLCPDILVYPDTPYTSHYSREGDWEVDGSVIPADYLAAARNTLAIEIKTTSVNRPSVSSDASDVAKRYTESFFTGILIIIWIVRPGDVCYTATYDFGS